MSSFPKKRREVEQGTITTPRTSKSSSIKKAGNKAPRAISDGFELTDTFNKQHANHSKKLDEKSQRAANQSRVSWRNDEPSDPHLSRPRALKRQRILDNEEDDHENQALPELPFEESRQDKDPLNDIRSNDSLPGYDSPELSSDKLTTTLDDEEPQPLSHQRGSTTHHIGKTRFQLSSSPSTAKNSSSHVRPTFLPQRRSNQIPISNNLLQSESSSPFQVTPQPKSFLFKESNQPIPSFDSQVADTDARNIGTDERFRKLPPSVSILPEAFSPHRRNDRFRQGGWASQVRSWIIESSISGEPLKNGYRIDQFSGKVVKIISCNATAASGGNCAGFNIARCGLVSSKKSSDANESLPLELDVLLVGDLDSILNYSQPPDIQKEGEPAHKLEKGAFVRLGNVAWSIAVHPTIHVASSTEGQELGVCVDWKKL